SGERSGRVQRCRWVFRDGKIWRLQVCRAWQGEGDPTLGPTDLREVVADVGDHRVVEAIRLVEGLERVLDGEWLAARLAQIGLEGVAESAVGILVWAKRSDHGVRRPITEVVCESQPVEQPSGEQHKGLCPLEGVGSDCLHARTVRTRFVNVLTKTATARSQGEAAGETGTDGGRGCRPAGGTYQSFQTRPGDD